MIRISSKTEYALRAVLHICEYGNVKKPSQLDEISKAQKIPREFLVQIMPILTKAGFVTSRRGSRGGYVLGKNSRKIFLKDVVETIDGSIGEFKCGLPSYNCMGKSSCVFRPVWEDLTKDIINKLGKVSLHELCNKHMAGTG